MDIKLTKDNEVRIIKFGPTLFPTLLIIPFVGLVIALVFWFRRGQYKEFFCQLIILLLIIVFFFFTLNILFLIMPQMASGLLVVTPFVWIGTYIYFMGSSVKNANMWRLRALIQLGYKPENEVIYNMALQYKKPSWMFFSSF